MVSAELTADRLRDLLDYNPATGKFHWRGAHRRIRPGMEAGTVNTAGHRSIKIDGRRHYAHRLAWLHVHGTWPKDQIDHINGAKDDNRLMNLRDVDQHTNMQNLHGPTKQNQGSKILGAYFAPKSKRWWSKIRIDGHQTYLGSFPDATQAAQAYLAAKRAHHPGCTI